MSVSSDPAIMASPLLVSAGEPAGIGPDLCVLLAAQGELHDAVVVADADLLAARAEQLGLTGLVIERLAGLSGAVPAPGGTTSARRVLRVWHHALAAPVVAGVLDVRNAPYVLQCLDEATDACAARQACALVTAPVQKSVIADAGVAFTGHTEYLAERLGVPMVVMMLVGGSLRVALATTHLPLRAVADAITGPLLDQVLTILQADLRDRFGLAQPRILVAGLNPHAGEQGHLGDEEIQIILPALQRARARGMRVEGPLPADTLFTPKHLAGADAVLAMYHDQGLPVLKMQSFGGGVNVTLGLPIVRTSVDHGTALDLAGTGQVDPGSLREALALARQLASVAGAGAGPGARAGAGAGAGAALGPMGALATATVGTDGRAST